MKSFPMFIKTTGGRVVIVGGAEQAAQKTRLMLKTDAEIVVCAPELEAELNGLAIAGRPRHDSATITQASFNGAVMAFIATGCPGADASLHALAQAARVPTNVVDQPSHCDITTPSFVDRDPVIVAIGTEGNAPVLARKIKTQIEQSLDPRLGGFAALAGRMRGAVRVMCPSRSAALFGTGRSMVRRGKPINAGRSVLPLPCSKGQLLAANSKTNQPDASPWLGLGRAPAIC
jgi:uroporphyrin-III C-methyltransferase/precorrin-2 dehydrogenase/sirohydrochlorin ferrochelatase